MKKFMDKDFLLSTATAERLYHETAEKLPIIDYHCHIPPQEIAEDRKFSTITQVWLGGDHYKWRLMRAAGIPEELVTGNGEDRDKFRAFASVMPELIGNPIYHWSHLELQRTFGIYEPLTAENADEIYDRCNEILKGKTARSFLQDYHVKVVCTTDDPADDLSWHRMIAEDPAIDTKVLPTFRPDKAINIEKAGFADYLHSFEKVCGREITTVKDMAAALCERIEYFANCGCKLADHGMDYCMYQYPDEIMADEALALAVNGEMPGKQQVDAYKTCLTLACAKKYKELGFAMQIHFGCLRNTNSIQFDKLGPDSGYDAINSNSGVENLAPLLNTMKENDGLPKTVIYSLNPADNAAIDTIAGGFQGDGKRGYIQHGSAWWFNDHRLGMREQLSSLAANGVLGCFVGMLTDSRSFLSYTRHEYFRRVLCEYIGELVESGQYPDDEKTLSKIVENICFCNANNYFDFNV